MNGRDRWLNTYTPSYTRALRRYADDFVARDLDADDHAFLEHVRQCGLANGELPSRSNDFDEEIEFWTQPFTVEPHPVEQQIVRLLRPIEDPEVRRKRLEKRKRDKAMMMAALESEREHWNRQQQERFRHQMRQTLDDEEWERAARPKFGKTINRHFIPQWKLDESRAETLRRVKVAKLAQQRARERTRELLEEQSRARIEAARAMVAQAKAERAEREANERVAVETKKAAAAEKGWMERKNKKAVLIEALTNIIRGTYPKVWSVDELMRATGCRDRELLLECGNEMAGVRYVSRPA